MESTTEKPRYDDFYIKEEYISWTEFCTISDCLLDLGLLEYARDINALSTHNKYLKDKYLNIILKEAIRVNNNEVIDKLCMAALI